jgi:hypothetical protein
MINKRLLISGTPPPPAPAGYSIRADNGWKTNINNNGSTSRSRGSVTFKVVGGNGEVIDSYSWSVSGDHTGGGAGSGSTKTVTIANGGGQLVASVTLSNGGGSQSISLFRVFTYL